MKKEKNKKIIFLFWLILAGAILGITIFSYFFYINTVAKLFTWQPLEIQRPVQQNFLESLPMNSWLQIATYDRSNQAVHPDIVFKNNQTGGKFYLVFTPYPFSRDQFENPSILTGTDGLNFKEERNGLNPLVPAPALDHNDDPNLFFDPLSKQFWLDYLETLRPAKQNLMRLSSYDGIEWQKEKIMEFDLKQGDDFILSPALVKGREGYYLFVVNKNRDSLRLGYYLSANGKSWNKNNFKALSINWPEKFIPWHVDVFFSDDWYYFLVNGGDGRIDRQSLLLGRSRDLQNWELNKGFLVKAGTFGSKLIYRSTGLVDDKYLGVWFSFLTYDNRWQIGFKKFELDSLFR